jgi:hypothetical protein
MIGRTAFSRMKKVTNCKESKYVAEESSSTSDCERGFQTT